MGRQGRIRAARRALHDAAKLIPSGNVVTLQHPSDANMFAVGERYTYKPIGGEQWPTRTCVAVDAVNGTITLR